jgi:hypothetical protein
MTEPKPRKSFLYRLVRALLIIVLVVGVLAITLRALLPAILRSQIQSQVSAILNLDVVIERLEVSVYRGRLSLDNVRVLPQEGVGDQDVLHIGSLVVDVSWPDLRKRRLHIQEFLLHDVTILALRQEGGARNIGPFLERYRKESKPKAKKSNQEPAPVEEARPVKTVSDPSGEKDLVDVWTLRIGKADIRNVSFTVRSEGEPSRQRGQAVAKLSGMHLTNFVWPSDGSSARLSVGNFKLDGIEGRWPEARILTIANASLDGQLTPSTLIVEDAVINGPQYRQSWDHLNRDQIERTESLIELVFSVRDPDENEEESNVAVVPLEEPPPAAEEPTASAEVTVAEQPDGPPLPPAPPAPRVRKPSEERPSLKTEIQRLRIRNAAWIRQTRIDGIWVDVLTNFNLDIDQSENTTTTVLHGTSNVEGSEFDIRYTLDEKADREITIQATRMPFHQMFWGEPVKDDRIPRVEHVLYNLTVNATHSTGVLKGDGLASFVEVRMTPDRRPIWQRISLKGGGWATILGDLVDPETGSSPEVPFEVERPLEDFSLFLLYTELQAAFDQSRLAPPTP